ncbi:MAG: ketoacyl-ACP synthase III [Selenomonadaceae bacterium]|nr:ketoacyl-ACP synthase III [Selenomonadaceae bacterium]
MLFTVENAALEIVSAYVSKNRVTIEERLKNLVADKKISRLKKGTGFEAFSIADENICASDYCAAAAEKIFATTEIKQSDIRAIIFVTQTPDFFLPSTSHVLHNRLNLPRDAVAFDINLGCSGFVYGLYVAASLVQNLDGKILLLCGDTVTRNIFADDISCLSVFGDAGTAAIISKRHGEKIFFNVQTYGELKDVILMQRGAYRNKLFVENNSLNVRENFVTMDGAAVMDFSTKFVPKNLADLMNFAQVDESRIANFFLHQANRLMLQNIASQLQIPFEKVPFKSARIGNTSSASIPVTLCEMKRIEEPINFLSVLSGFGVGMSLASAVVDLTNLICLPTEEM